SGRPRAPPTLGTAPGRSAGAVRLAGRLAEVDLPGPVDGEGTAPVESVRGGHSAAHESYGPRPRRSGGTSMSVIEGAADIDVPVHMAYNQWTQFECFPRFMHGV